MTPGKSCRWGPKNVHDSEKKKILGGPRGPIHPVWALAAIHPRWGKRLFLWGSLLCATQCITDSVFLCSKAFSRPLAGGGLSQKLPEAAVYGYLLPTSGG